MTLSMPEIHAVVEVGIPTYLEWDLLPAKPWPDYVRLCGSTSSSDVALVLAVLSYYGRSVETGEGWGQSLVDNFPRILPGGLAVVSTESRVMPSCCCGLETWPDWRNVIAIGQSPWMGHDPAPLIEVAGTEILVWSDGGMGEKPIAESPIAFPREEFELALQRAADDLCEFRKPLRQWLGAHAPLALVDALVAKFESAFVQQ
jgi:hypothetical protein